MSDNPNACCRRSAAPAELKGGLATQPRAKNYAALPFASVPAFVAGQLEKADTGGRLALLFTIFTTARSGEVRNARWEQIDLEARTWSRPAEIMKTRLARHHRPARAVRPPHVAGVPTWLLKDRWLSGEPMAEMMEDLSIARAEVLAALRFEEIDPDKPRKNEWLN